MNVFQDVDHLRERKIMKERDVKVAQTWSNLKKRRSRLFCISLSLYHLHEIESIEREKIQLNFLIKWEISLCYASFTTSSSFALFWTLKNRNSLLISCVISTLNLCIVKYFPPSRSENDFFIALRERKLNFLRTPIIIDLTRELRLASKNVSRHFTHSLSLLKCLKMSWRRKIT